MSAIQRHVDHVGYTVSNLDRSVEFYTLLLEEPPTARKTYDAEYLGHLSGYPGVKVEAAFWKLPSSFLFELIQYHNPPHSIVDMKNYNVGNAHLALVANDLHNEFERLSKHAKFRSPAPVQIEWGPYKGGWAARMRDPDGITVEWIQLPPGGVNLY